MRWGVACGATKRCGFSWVFGGCGDRASLVLIGWRSIPAYNRNPPPCGLRILIGEAQEGGLLRGLLQVSRWWLAASGQFVRLLSGHVRRLPADKPPSIGGCPASGVRHW